tara:strand:- start:7103 stop:7339 length:237 start_codon:yes stop_codon:yes gene_type:complete
MSSIMNGECKLVPKAGKWYGAADVPPGLQEEQKSAEEGCVAQALNAIRSIIAIIQPFCFDALLELPVLPCDIVLRLKV